MTLPTPAHHRKNVRLYNPFGAGSESQEQQALFLWWRMVGCRTYGLKSCQLFAIPNGGRRSLRTAARMKREGVVAGIPDAFLAEPRGTYHGLFIEMKRADKHGRLSELQKESIYILKTAGYCCVVSHGWEDAKKAIHEYLTGNNAVPSDKKDELGYE